MTLRSPGAASLLSPLRCGRLEHDPSDLGCNRRRHDPRGVLGADLQQLRQRHQECGNLRPAHIDHFCESLLHMDRLMALI